MINQRATDMNKICAIHQPNFFPWLGYFDKIKQVDEFVFLDEVLIVKTGSSWVNRVKVNCNGTAKWITCPIKRVSGTQKISEVEFVDIAWKEDFIRVLDNYYRKHHNFYNGIKIIKEIIYSHNSLKLAEFNVHCIKALVNYLGIKANFILQSDLNADSSSTQLLIDLTKAVNCNAYLCGGGASGYQEDGLFAKAGVKLIYQDYEPKPYGDPLKFIPGLSIVDFLMSEHA